MLAYTTAFQLSADEFDHFGGQYCERESYATHGISAPSYLFIFFFFSNPISRVLNKNPFDYIPVYVVV